MADGEVKLTVANSGVIWDRTSELRIVRTKSPQCTERLQQRWYCPENGSSEWVDVSIVDE